MLPHRRIHDSRVGRVHGEICCARLIVNLQNRFPGISTICRSINASLVAGSPDLTLHRRINEIGIGRVHNDPSNLTCVLESYVFPGFAGIGRLVHAVAVAGCDTANRSLTCSNVDNVFICFGHRDGANGTDTKVAIRYVTPGVSRVIGLP